MHLGEIFIQGHSRNRLNDAVAISGSCLWPGCSEARWHGSEPIVHAKPPDTLSTRCYVGRIWWPRIAQFKCAGRLCGPHKGTSAGTPARVSAPCAPSSSVSAAPTGAAGHPTSETAMARRTNNPVLRRSPPPMCTRHPSGQRRAHRPERPIRPGVRRSFVSQHGLFPGESCRNGQAENEQSGKYVAIHGRQVLSFLGLEVVAVQFFLRRS